MARTNTAPTNSSTICQARLRRANPSAVAGRRRVLGVGYGHAQNHYAENARSYDVYHPVGKVGGDWLPTRVEHQQGSQHSDQQSEQMAADQVTQAGAPRSWVYKNYDRAGTQAGGDGCISNRVNQEQDRQDGNHRQGGLP